MGLQMIKRPMKFPSESISDARLEEIEYPVVVSPKLDGYRCLCDGVTAFTSSLKPVTNRYIQKCLTGEDYRGFDGELIVGSPFALNEDDDVFNRTTGPVRRADGEPDFKYYVFDDWRFQLDGYGKRWINQVNDYPEIHDIPFVIVIEQRLCHNVAEVLAAFNEFEEMGYEGAIIRRLTAPYKEGRCTYREEFGFKKASWAYAEAFIEDAYEQDENQNEKTVNELGLSKRSSHKENKVGKGTLGGYVLRCKLFEETFRCGTIKGGTLAFRQEQWDKWIADPESIRGLPFKFKYKVVGTLEKPRQPIGIGFRDPNDMTDY
jgi:DNA ligase-1